MKGVILAAGYATRFLPASKTIPKEMFPLIDRPVIDFIVQEMVDSGIQEILLISSRRKKAMEDYFDREVELSTSLEKAKKLEKLRIIEPINASIFTLRQQFMMGTGNALMLAEPFVKDEPFIVAYPDDVVIAQENPLSLQLIETYQKTGKTTLAVQELHDQDVSRYGVIDEGQKDGNVVEVRKMVEKPEVGTEPSKVVSYGRYLYAPEIFEALHKSAEKYDDHGEFTQTEAINWLAQEGKVNALKFEGERYDVGEPLGYVQTSVLLAMKREKFKQPMMEFLKKVVTENS